VKAGRHYLMAELSNFVYGSSDRLFLFVLAGATTVGLYDAAYKLIQPFYAISSVAVDSMYRSLARSFGTCESNHVFRRWVDVMSVATIPVGFVTLAFAPALIDLVYGSQFRGAETYLALLGFVITFGYMAGIVTIPFTAWNAPAPYGQAVFAGGAANIVLNVMLIPSLGGIGAGLATLTAKVTVGLAGFRTFRRLTDYPVLRDFGWYLVVSAACVIFGLGLGVVTGVPTVVQLAAVAALYAALVSPRILRSVRAQTTLSSG
jgi:O-antigen/teichoic acid export membrane protein